ncbi:MAG: zf-TFIIB domain-containing protein [Deltaproteobacteria bacterium]|nr:zf-TFIIB domain-containing protein [Deltaproteobacteria bacterium]
MSSTVKPSHEEEEYFARQEIEARKALAEKVREDMHATELENLKKLHLNHCAKCGFEMHPVLFKGVTIEKCPNCGGIFLDAGELEQLAGKQDGFVSSVLGLFKF